MINSHLLYQLSYSGTLRRGGENSDPPLLPATLLQERTPLARLGFTLLALLSLAVPPLAAQAGAAPPELRVHRITRSVTLDGRLDEPEWASADSLPGLTQVTPVEAAPPASRTVVRVLASTRDLTFGIVAYGAPGIPLTSYTKVRDGDLDEEDYLALVLDTFRDGRSGYVFAVNPAGARLDGLVARQGEDVDESWDAIWEAATWRDGNTWSAEIRIPVRSLIFRAGLTSWGFNLQRYVAFNQEVSRWASPQQNIEATQTSRAGLLLELPDFSLGIGLSVRPAAVAGGGHPAPDTGLDGTLKPSLDLTQRIGANLLTSLTLNTDFAETDVDTRRTNLTRFPLFFPEKRTFFLEGKDIFEFGPNLGEEVIPFFSRRIGLLQGTTVPLRAGLKLNGRAGPANFGALITRTGHLDDVTEGQTMAALRVRQNVLAESSLGAIATFGDPLGRGDARTLGADAIYHTSRFLGGKNLTVGVWGLQTDREGLEGDRSAYGVLLDYPNDVWDVVGSIKHIGDGFDPSLGFVPRRGIRRYRAGINFSPRPRRFGIRQMFFEQSYTLVTDLDGRWESYSLFFAPLNWRLESGDRVEANFNPQGERLIEPFEVADTVSIAPGTYRFTRYRLELEFASRRNVSGLVAWRFGGFYDGHLHQFQVEGAWKPTSSLILEVEGEHNVGRLPGGPFDESVIGVRGLVNLSPDLTISSFLQFDSESRSFGSNTRLRWTFHPAGDLFVVYNHNLQDFESRWRFESNQLLVKAQYTLRY